MSTTSTELFLTYVELAERLSIKPESARKLSQRRKWVRVVGNDGIARVKVPMEAVSGTVPSGIPRPIMASADKEKIASLEGLIEGMKREMFLMEKRVEDISTDRDAWKQQAQRSIWSRLFRDS